jgi:hypothetical protein
MQHLHLLFSGRIFVVTDNSPHALQILASTNTTTGNVNIIPKNHKLNLKKIGCPAIIHF